MIPFLKISRGFSVKVALQAFTPTFSRYRILLCKFMPALAVSFYRIFREGVGISKLGVVSFIAFYRVAFSAHPSFCVNAGISNRKRMAVITEFSLGEYTPLHVDFLSNCFKVFGVYARGVSAQMIKYKPLRYFTISEGVRKPVYKPNFAFIRSHTVAKSVNSALPNPACFGFKHLAPKSLFSISVSHNPSCNILIGGCQA